MANYELTDDNLAKLRRARFFTRGSRVRAITEAFDKAVRDREQANAQMANAMNVSTICSQDARTMRMAVEQMVDTRAYWRSCATQLASALEHYAQTPWPSEAVVKAAEDALREYEALARVAPKTKL